MAVTDKEQDREQREDRSDVGEPEKSERDGAVERDRSESRDPDRADSSGRNQPEDEEPDQPEASGREQSAVGEEDAEDDESEGGEDGQGEKPAKREKVKGIAGGAAIFLLLGIYFVWIGSEMGSHALSGTFEMWAIFGAIFLGVAALVAGGAISRKKQEHDDD